MKRDIDWDVLALIFVAVFVLVFGALRLQTWNHPVRDTSVTVTCPRVS